jgi:phasin family protein
MSTKDETKPAGKSKRRKDKAGKRAVAQMSPPESPARTELPSPEQQPQSVRTETPKVRQPPAVEVPVVALAAPPEPQPSVALPSSEPVSAAPPAAETKSADSKPAELKPNATEAVEPISAEPPQAEPSPNELAPVSLQALANAYRDYTRKSIEEFGSFVEQLSGARSLDKAMTVQTEFVKRAYETSVAESHKIYELHNRLAKQTLDPFKGLTGKTPAPHRKP